MGSIDKLRVVRRPAGNFAPDLRHRSIPCYNSPSNRMVSARGKPLSEDIILPAVTLGAALSAILTRMIRSSVIEELGEDYVRTARAKGLSERKVVYKHVLKNGLIPVVTILGLQLGVLLAGSIITEKIFSWQGLGLLLLEDGIAKRDYRLVQGCVLVISLTYIIANSLTDLFIEDWTRGSA